MNKVIVAVLAVVAVIALAAGGLWVASRFKVITPVSNGVTDGIVTGEMMPVEGVSGVDEAIVVDEAEVKEFSVSGSEYKFTPQTITVNQGDRIRITFSNSGNMPHDLVIDEFDVNTGILPPGSAPQTVEFVADRTGTFQYYCSVGNHRAMGMVGNLVVQ